MTETDPQFDETISGEASEPSEASPSPPAPPKRRSRSTKKKRRTTKRATRTRTSSTTPRSEPVQDAPKGYIAYTVFLREQDAEYIRWRTALERSARRTDAWDDGKSIEICVREVKNSDTRYKQLRNPSATGPAADFNAAAGVFE